jgi:hypothetical protein
MKTNQYLGDCEPLSVLFSANDPVDRTNQGLELDCAGQNRLVGNSPGGVVAAAVAGRGPFPHRTLIVCFTIWLIVTQAMIFDQVKFKTRVRLIEQQTRSFSGPRLVVPNEQRSNSPSGAKVQRL